MVRVAARAPASCAVSTACCTTRYAVRSTPVGSEAGSPSTFSSTSSPAWRMRSSSAWSRPRPGWGASSGLVLLVAQHAEQTPHLGERVAAGLLDDEKVLPGGGGVAGGDHARHGARLDDHGAEPVGHDGLELLGYAAALILDRAPRELLAVRL